MNAALQKFMEKYASKTLGEVGGGALRMGKKAGSRIGEHLGKLGAFAGEKATEHPKTAGAGVLAALGLGGYGASKLAEGEEDPHEELDETDIERYLEELKNRGK